MYQIFMGFHGACCKWLEHYHIQAKGVLANAIDTEEYELYEDEVESKKEEIKILYAGRLIQDKGILLLKQAYDTLRKKYHNIKLIIAGDGPLYEDLKKNTKIQMLGKLNHDELMKQYAKADIFINPSYSEGLPTSILEAGLMKCAVVATNVGGTSEIIEDAKTGLLCKPDTADIIEKLETVIQDEKLQKKLAESLHEKIVKKFSWEITTNKILEIIK